MDPFYLYFLEPIMRNGWFNPVNSVVYGICLIAGGWLVFTLLRRLRIGIDGKLFVSLLPFIAFAGVTRTLRDYVYFSSLPHAQMFLSFQDHIWVIQQNAYSFVMGRTGNAAFAYVDSFVIAWFPTPGSYLITFALALASLLISVAVQRYLKVPYWKPMFVMGFALFMANAVLLPVNSLEPLIYIGFVSCAWMALFYGISVASEAGLFRKLHEGFSRKAGEIFTEINSGILSAHFFDATATFFAIAFFSTLAGGGYTEQHFLSRSLMPFLGPQVMFLLKFVVVVPVLYVLNREVKDRDFRNFLLLVVFILGMAPAARNLARLMVGV